MLGLGCLVGAYSSHPIHVCVCVGGGCSSHSFHKTKDVGPQSMKGVGFGSYARSSYTGLRD